MYPIVLYLAWNGITETGITSLANGNLTGLRWLYLSKYANKTDQNGLGAEGCRQLTRANWSKLHTLDLCKYYNKAANNNIGD